ncbi:ABC transporter permease [Cytophagaceae bacterium DM2B3-1]|uniref:ABC transporter permease n=1 Tax=Xanthocytophaga flava TaxID=3048013 RepID=A0AAE3QRT3_9BACT|nr:ABC transporter permease [Xanthocytophaga flavus]MDJ1472261.1 ABC transporter permease [Xanthocytophaga flavus]MDJ1482021.1 ABC transporter permease [Xanthocytophaga flavus]MDJ1492272.1 ABC transporter permease [Xanthocytophaga flavus]
MYLLSQFGKYCLFIASMFRNREKFGVYVSRILDECMLIGIDSIFIVVIVSTFIGAVTALQTVYNLVSPLIPLTIVGVLVRDTTILELASTVICIVLCGKVGSNIAGGLGTMRITEQIDALEVMGINSASYLVLPKIIAALITFPMLVILASFLSIYGGYLSSTLSGLVTKSDYIYGIRSDFNPGNVRFSLVKSFVFAFLISSISAFQGYYTRGGALEVGQSSTKAVTNSCIAVLLADYLLAQLLL